MKKYFIAGLLVWVPLAVTVWVLTWGLGLLDGVFGTVMGALSAVLPDALHPQLESFRNIPGLGIVLVLAVILVTGAAAANFAGQWALRQGDRLLQKIPIVKSIYSSVKQVSDTLFSSDGNAFRKALLVQYPREGMWTIGFMTGTPGGDVQNHLHGEYVSVYVPTTPNPTSGFFLMLRKEDVIELDMSVDAALKYIVSMGVVAPPNGNGEVAAPERKH
ncbi:MAG: DUF502 domain-containing protein [Candidatus Protistobacter heckmanni]|nr:DUF502 domain-containing protein [Candidatus Protistobacter heckmanni]